MSEGSVKNIVHVMFFLLTAESCTVRNVQNPQLSRAVPGLGAGRRPRGSGGTRVLWSMH
jgi:hypothetical protein